MQLQQQRMRQRAPLGLIRKQPEPITMLNEPGWSRPHMLEPPGRHADLILRLAHHGRQAHRELRCRAPPREAHVVATARGGVERGRRTRDRREVQGPLVDELMQGRIQREGVGGRELVLAREDAEHRVAQVGTETDCEHHPERRDVLVFERDDRVRDDVGVFDRLGFQRDGTRVEVPAETVFFLLRGARGRVAGGWRGGGGGEVQAAAVGERRDVQCGEHRLVDGERAPRVVGLGRAAAERAGEAEGGGGGGSCGCRGGAAGTSPGAGVQERDGEEAREEAQVLAGQGEEARDARWGRGREVLEDGAEERALLV